jgi:hypothetical protein
LQTAILVCELKLGALALVPVSRPKPVQLRMQ